GPTTDGCVVSGKLVRIQLSGDVMTGSPQVLLKDQWCQQFPSHSIGDLRFGPDGDLYVSGGEGASFGYVDYGQSGGSRSGPPTTRCATRSVSRSARGRASCGSATSAGTTGRRSTGSSRRPPHRSPTSGGPAMRETASRAVTRRPA